MDGRKKDHHPIAVERRESPRRGAEFAARFRVISGETGRVSKEIPGTVKNLSESGFCLATNFTIVEELHVLASSSGVTGNTLDLQISLPDHSNLKMLGAACWYDLAGEDDPCRYNVGIRITEISPDNLTALKTFLRLERKARWKSFGSRWLSRLLRRSYT